MMQVERFALLPGDCMERLRDIPDASVDACVTDPPYGLGFMGKHWDHPDNIAFRWEVWGEVFRVLKPGGHLLAASGTRTYHRLATAIEEAEFEIRDMVSWLYGSGFPKSLDVSKAIDAAAGAEREVVGTKLGLPGYHLNGHDGGEAFGHGLSSSTYETRLKSSQVTAPATDAARQWQGWGTALKPATEPWVFAQKPYTLEGLCVIVARNLMEALCRFASHAKGAASNFSLSRNGSAPEFASAHWNAVAGCNTPADLFALMATWPSGLEIPMSLSTVSSWLLTLDGLLSHSSTFTTETRSSLTTDLRTLNSYLLSSTPSIIDPSELRQRGIVSNACPVERIFSVVDTTLRLTLARSALGLATSQADEPGFRLSPNCEPFVLARKPLIGTVAENVLAHGTGALNVDGCRVSASAEDVAAAAVPKRNNLRMFVGDGEGRGEGVHDMSGGRWPANVIHDGSDEVTGMFPEATARFFYATKASKRDRAGSKHPTVKPIALMRYLCRLITPPGGLILDPFAGTGTTGEAALLEGFRAILIEREPEYQADIRRRMEALQPVQVALL